MLFVVFNVGSYLFLDLVINADRRLRHKSCQAIQSILQKKHQPNGRYLVDERDE